MLNCSNFSKTSPLFNFIDKYNQLIEPMIKIFKKHVLPLYYFGSIKQFKMPDLGEKIKEATVKKWHVQVGDVVEEVVNFQPIADVSTDKLFTQIPSNFSGKIHKIFHGEEDICQVGELFVEIEVDEEGVTSEPSAQAEKKESKPVEAAMEQTIEKQVRSGSGILATPAVRGLAKEKKVDLKQVKGSGEDGRILKADIESFLSKSNQQSAQSQVKIQASSKARSESVEAVQTIKMNDFMKGMQKSMTTSNTIPHLYLKEEVDLTELAELREKIKKQAPIPITFMSLFIKSFSMALLKYPIINSTYDINNPFEFKQYKNHNISLALDSPNGLVVPNIKNVQDLSIIQVQEELQRLRDLGSKGQLSQKELFDGTVCISNIGTIGGTYTGPLILPPQICIVGVGRVIEQPRYDKHMNVVPRKIMNLSFGCDHRVLDGATVTRFSNEWRKYLEDPAQMLIHLK